MPDLIRRYFWRCDSELSRTYASKSRPGEVYTAVARGFEVTCDCPGYRNHRKCWHSQEVWDEHCTWNEEWNSMGLEIVKTRDEAYVCPNCGGPVASFADAV